MSKTKIWLVWLILILFPLSGLLLNQAYKQEPVYKVLPGSGKKCWIGEKYYFTYKFVEKPKLGTAILKIQLFDKGGDRFTNLEIAGNSGMPSMGGAHDSGEVLFKLNKKGDYLLPVNIVMPGEWEVRLTFTKDKKVIYRGSFKFNV
jgi:hypothetical protein